MLRKKKAYGVVFISMAIVVLLMYQHVKFSNNMKSRNTNETKKLIQREQREDEKKTSKADGNKESNIGQQKVLLKLQTNNAYEGSFTFEDTEVKTDIFTRCANLRRLGQMSTFVSPQDHNQLLLDDRHKLLYCALPKVACSTLKNMFLILTGKVKTTNPLAVNHRYTHNMTFYKPLYKLPEKEMASILKHYKKFIIIRDPFERLLSAYRSKMETLTDRAFAVLRRQIVYSYRENVSTEHLEKSNVPTFLEFIKYLTDPKRDLEKKDKYNSHWDLYSNLCFPCTVNYDFIGHFETLEHDVNRLFTTIPLNFELKLPPRNASYKQKRTKEVVNQFYSQIPKYYVQKIWNIFQKDYYIFNLPFPNVLRSRGILQE